MIRTNLRKKNFRHFDISVRNWEKQKTFLLQLCSNSKILRKMVFKRNFSIFIQTKCGSETVEKKVSISDVDCEVGSLFWVGYYFGLYSIKYKSLFTKRNHSERAYSLSSTQNIP